MPRRARTPEELPILTRAVESAGEGFVTIDQDHRVVLFNRAAERLFGYRREEVLGRDLNTILAPACSADHRAGVDRYLRSRRPRALGHARELTAVRKGGQTFPCTISFSVARMKGQVFFTGIVRDLSETKALQAEVAKRERLAELGRMVAEINHEIRNPLMIIGGFVNRLSRAATDPKTRMQVSMIATEVRRLETLLEELRRLYLPRKLRVRRFDLNGLLREIHLFAAEACSGTGLRVQWDPDPDPLRVRADREKLKQVLVNLVRNAVEAMGDSGTVRLATERSAQRVSVTVSDDGPGIPEKIQARIFDPFFTTKRGGSGLGLPLCRRIVEDHRGAAMHLISAQGKGTQVRIDLPVRQHAERPGPGRRQAADGGAEQRAVAGPGARGDSSFRT